MVSRLFERLFVVVLLLSSMGVVDSLTRPASTEQSGLVILADKAPLATVVVQVGIYLWGFILVSLRWRRVLGAARTVWPLIAFIALAPLSTLWSVQPSLTLQRSAMMMVMTLFAIYMGERYSIEGLARLLAQTLCVMILAVIIIHFVAPAYVIDQRFVEADAAHRGGWKGLSEHKNLFGEYMALAIALFTLVRFRYHRWLRYGFLLSAAFLLVLARSANALACAVLIVAAIPLWRLARLNRKQRVLAYTMIAVAICLGIGVIWTNTGLLFQILGRDSTLSGRTGIWDLVLRAIMKHPILGYGYGAFWDAMKGETLDVWLGVGFVARGAHNGYLDLCLSYGLLGLPFFIYMFFHYFRFAIEYVRSEPGRVAVWPVTYLCFFALQNVTESGLMQSWRSLPFLMFATIITSLAINRRRQEIAVRYRTPGPQAALTPALRAFWS